jgi:hypothetical protein
MNERFRELLKQSTNPPWDGEQGTMNEFNLERFAELIVKECALLCSDPVVILQHWGFDSKSE